MADAPEETPAKTPGFEWIQRMREEREEQFKRGDAEIGGLFLGSPLFFNPAGHYARAVKVLAEACERAGEYDSLALSIVYNLRHGVELMLKDSCKTAHSVLESLNMGLPAPDFDKEHNLEKWTNWTTTALTALNYELPPVMVELVQKLTEMKDGNGEKWRYGYVKAARKQPAEFAFPQTEKLPIRNLVDLFAQTYQAVFGNPKNPMECGLLMDLCDEEPRDDYNA